MLDSLLHYEGMDEPRTLLAVDHGYMPRNNVSLMEAEQHIRVEDLTFYNRSQSGDSQHAPKSTVVTRIS